MQMQLYIMHQLIMQSASNVNLAQTVHFLKWTSSLLSRVYLFIQGINNLLGFKWDGQFYYDKPLPMGCHSSCAIFETFSTAVEWIAKKKLVISGIVHILDDFLIIAPQCVDGKKHLTQFLTLCNSLRIPLAPDKTEGPTSCLTFAGIELDAVAMEARLPP